MPLFTILLLFSLFAFWEGGRNETGGGSAGPSLAWHGESFVSLSGRCWMFPPSKRKRNRLLADKALSWPGLSTVAKSEVGIARPRRRRLDRPGSSPQPSSKKRIDFWSSNSVHAGQPGIVEARGRIPGTAPRRARERDRDNGAHGTRGGRGGKNKSHGWWRFSVSLGRRAAASRPSLLRKRKWGLALLTDMICVVQKHSGIRDAAR